MNLGTNNLPNTTNLVRRYIIIGERRLSNYWWASVILLGACGFLYTGISAYVGHSLFSFNAVDSNTFDIAFFPQGLLMSFYGSLGLLLSIYWILLIFWNVGGGFNEFNKKDGFIRIFRWGYPGKNRKIDLTYSLKDVEAIRVELKQGLDPQRTIFLRLKGGANANFKTAFNQGTNPSLASQGTEGKAKTTGTNATINFKREIPLTGISQPLTLKEIEKQASELANFLQVSLEGL
jgi:hypothetical protein